MIKAGISDDTLRARIGMDWSELISECVRDGVESKSLGEMRAYLAKKWDLPVWWQRNVAYGIDRRLHLGQSNRQRNGRFRQTTQRTLTGTPSQIFKRLTSEGELLTYLQAAEESEIYEGLKFSTEYGFFVVTDVDDVGWLRLERTACGSTSVVHISVRGDSGRVSFHVAESDLPNQESCIQSSTFWTELLDALEAP